MTAPSSYFDALPINENWLKTAYLFGLELTDQYDNEFPEELFANAIDAAIARVQRELDISVVPITHSESHDYEIDYYKNWSYIPVDHLPILEVTSVRAEFPFGQTAVEFPSEWIVIDRLRRIQIVPRSGSMATVFLGAGQILLPLLHGATGYVPDLIIVDYSAGFRPDEIPADVLHAICLYASINVLNIAGDLIIGPGISNQELMIQGARQRIETTASPTNSGYGARILQYRKELNDTIPNLRRYYQGLKMVIA